MPLASPRQSERSAPGVRHVSIAIDTTIAVEFVDLTATLQGLVTAMGFTDGFLAVHTLHTTTGLLVNELEPLLLEDLAEMFERIAPAARDYAHDDCARRTVNLTPAERRNGYAHCRAALLRASEQFGVADGEIVLGRWQRVLFVDFDGGQKRRVAVTFVGV